MEGSVGRHSGVSAGWLVITGVLCLVLGVVLAVAWYYPQLARKHKGLSTQELTAALGIHYWEFTIPDNDGTATLCFEIQDGENIETHGGAGNWTPGERVLVTVRRDMGSKTLVCAIIRTDGQNFWETLDDPFVGCGGFCFARDGISVNEHWLMKGNRKGGTTIVPADAVAPGDVVLRLMMKP